jgi:hypothetical protein
MFVFRAPWPGDNLDLAIKVAKTLYVNSVDCQMGCDAEAKHIYLTFHPSADTYLLALILTLLEKNLGTIWEPRTEKPPGTLSVREFLIEISGVTDNE